MNYHEDTNQPILQKPMVWLVGAGPGDPSLITLKALECIRQADIIVYDFLANPELLKYAHPSAELIPAGKKAGSHSIPQNELNQLLVNLAKSGKSVCRLKGGDPFLFGRGGEEALYLAQHNIPFEIVPGITSALAVPTYAGIPVTHRGLAAAVYIVTAHEDPSKEDGLADWEFLSNSTSATLVFLMVRKNARTVTEKLMKGKWDKTTPTAAIANGTLPNQKIIVDTLANIASRIEQELDDAPTLMVIGKTVALHEPLNWLKYKPLFGKRIVVTRASHQASSLCAHLHSLGAEVISFPTIQIRSLANTKDMQECIQSLHVYNWVIFTSVNAVECFFNALHLAHKDTRALATAQIAAIGPATENALEKYGVIADLIPQEHVAEALFETLKSHETLLGKRFLLPCSSASRGILPEKLKQEGAQVREVYAYETIEGAEPPAELLQQLRNNQIDLVLFTSSSTVRGFVKSLPAEIKQELLAHTRAASIGPITTNTLHEHGIPVVVKANPYTIPALVKAILAYFGKNNT